MGNSETNEEMGTDQPTSLHAAMAAEQNGKLQEVQQPEANEVEDLKSQDGRSIDGQTEVPTSSNSADDGADLKKAVEEISEQVTGQVTDPLARQETQGYRATVPEKPQVSGAPLNVAGARAATIQRVFNSSARLQSEIAELERLRSSGEATVAGRNLSLVITNIENAIDKINRVVVELGYRGQ